MASCAEAEVEKIKILEDRIKAPSIWGKVPCGIRFEDLQDRRYEDAVRLLKKHYLSEELTYRSVKLVEDQEGTDEFVHNVRIWMKDKMSIAAVKEGTDKLVGVLIMRIQEKASFSRTFSKNKITHNPLYSAVMTFYNEVEKPVNVYEQLGIKRYFKVYLLALKNRYRHRGIAKEMMKAAIKLSASAYVPAVSGIFTTARIQQIAEELGFEKLHEIYYVRYIINDEGDERSAVPRKIMKWKVMGGTASVMGTRSAYHQIVFWDAGLGNYGAAIMVYRIPDVEEPQDLHVQLSSRFNIGQLDDEDDVDDEKKEGK